MDFKLWCAENKNINRLVKDLKSSTPEQYIGFYLSKVFNGNIEYSKQFGFLGKMSLDIYIPTLHLAIEYDGEYYHSKRVYNDEKKDILCSENGVDVIRICERSDRLSESAANNQILYYFSNNYSNIGIALSDLQRLLNNNYQCNIEFDVNLERDKDVIIQYIQEKYYKSTIAYHWPETLHYWMHEKNKKTPFDVFVTDNGVYHLKCPHCGKEYKLHMRYKHDKRALHPCDCELKKIEEQYHNFIKNYNEDVLFNDSLSSRRLYDRMMMGVKYPGQSSTDEEKRLLEGLRYNNHAE